MIKIGSYKIFKVKRDFKNTDLEKCFKYHQHATHLISFYIEVNAKIITSSVFPILPFQLRSKFQYFEKQIQAIE